MASQYTPPAQSKQSKLGPIQYGENGHSEYSWINVFQEKTMQLSFQLVRTTCSHQKNILRNKYSELLHEAFFSPIITTEHRQYHISILFRLMLHTRDIVSGKGEYNLFYILLGEWVKLGNQSLTAETNMINTLAEHALMSTVFLHGHDNAYGSWKDMKYFLHYLYSVDGITGPRRNLPIFKSAISCMVAQLKQDSMSDKPSLLAKWIPREKSNKFGWLAKYIACEYFSKWFVDNNDPTKHLDPHYDSKSPAGRKCLTHYRKLIASINKKLGTVQINQCEGTWSNIDFEKSVTSRTLWLQGRAFEYLDQNNKLRSPSIDRLRCSENYKEYIKKCRDGKATIKHARTDIMELVRAADEYIIAKNEKCDEQATDATDATETYRDMINLQWEEAGSIIDNFEKSTLKYCIPMVDTSGSMRENNADALHAAIALGCRIAEQSALGKRVMSFSNTAEWIDLSKSETLTDMVKTLRDDNSWGMNTNFEAALTRILDACIETNMHPDEVKKLHLIVLSDMQIDFADSNANSIHHRIEKMFEEGGKRTIHNQPYKPPHIVYWNLRSTSGFPSLSFIPNVSMVSGFSPTILNMFCEKGTEAFQYCTPWVMFNEQLNHKRYRWANYAIECASAQMFTIDQEMDIVADPPKKKENGWFSLW